MKKEISNCLSAKASEMLGYDMRDWHLIVSETAGYPEMFEVKIFQERHQLPMVKWDPVYVWGKIDDIAKYLNGHIYEVFFETNPDNELNNLDDDLNKIPISEEG